MLRVTGIRSKIAQCIVTSLLVICSDATSDCDDTSIDHISNYIRNTLSPFKVSLIAETFDGLSPLANKIVRKTREDFASSHTDYKGLSQPGAESLRSLYGGYRITEEQMGVYAKKFPERLSLTIGIVEIKHGLQKSQKMRAMLRYFDCTTPLVRGKYIVTLIHDDEINVEEFLRLAWSKGFLELIVIEWVSERKMNESKLDLIPTENEFRIFVHSFNPFCNTYRKEILTPKMEISPVRNDNLCGFTLSAGRIRISDQYISMRNQCLVYSYSETDLALAKSLVGALNGSVRLRLDDFPSEDSLDSDIDKRACDFYVPFMTGVFGPFAISNNATLTEEYFRQFFNIFIPEQTQFRFHLIRPKFYETRISLASIITFGGLIFTAWIFATWAYLLGFEEPNWSFLNILTAQMGGSIEHRGRMKLSEMIYQMSIYLATFIIVTVGADYMFGIFILQGTLTEIKTIQDLADSDISLVMGTEDYAFFENIVVKDPTLERIFNRTRPLYVAQGTHSFCTWPSTNHPILNQSINLCVTYSRLRHRTLNFVDGYQVDKIDEPFAVSWLTTLMQNIDFPLKSKLEDLVARFSEVGLLKWREEELKVLKYEDDWEGSKVDQSERIPLQKQLRPVFVIGCILSILALVGELIWKRFFEKTNFGRIVQAFYSNSRPGLERSHPLTTVSSYFGRRRVTSIEVGTKSSPNRP